MTISASGVTQYSANEMSFTPIEQWEREYIFYLKLLEVYNFCRKLYNCLYIFHFMEYSFFRMFL